MTNGTISLTEARQRARRQRASSRRCRVCGQLNSLRVVRHPSGHVVVCEHCGDVRVAARILRPA
jgi:transposase